MVEPHVPRFAGSECNHCGSRPARHGASRSDEDDLDRTLHTLLPRSPCPIVASFSKAPNNTNGAGLCSAVRVDPCQPRAWRELALDETAAACASTREAPSPPALLRTRLAAGRCAERWLLQRSRRRAAAARPRRCPTPPPPGASAPRATPADATCVRTCRCRLLAGAGAAHGPKLGPGPLACGGPRKSTLSVAAKTS
jgi:hypothetical protein